MHPLVYYNDIYLVCSDPVSALAQLRISIPSLYEKALQSAKPSDKNIPVLAADLLVDAVYFDPTTNESQDV